MLTNRYPQSIQWAHVKGIVGDLGDTIVPGMPMIRSLQLALFQVHGIHVNKQALSIDFGKDKHEHVKSILMLPSNQVKLDRKPSDRDVTAVVSRFEHNLMEHYDRQGVHYLSDTQCGIRSFIRNGVQFGCTTGLSENIIQVIDKKLPLYKPYPIVYVQRPSPAGIHAIVRQWNQLLPFQAPIAMHQVIKVGDSMADLEEAKQAGVAFIGIIGHRSIHFGWSKQMEQDFKQEMMLHGATLVVRSLDEVAGLLCPWTKRGMLI
jgi:phosphonoacetaldehyde hydrolase